MLPQISAYMKSYGDSATLRFTGHSLGGSVALLLSLMLVIRGEVPATSLLPVVTFGSPFIMCGGNHLLHKLGLPKNHVQAITMHRDIVPRAFACHYPDNVANILKAINGNFRHHPCLMNQVGSQLSFFSLFKAIIPNQCTLYSCCILSWRFSNYQSIKYILRFYPVSPDNMSNSGTKWQHDAI